MPLNDKCYNETWTSLNANINDRVGNIYFVV